ncbi:MAG: hypothetical protein HYT94_03345 [Parcubacteria group bacterium]|nr:hypothetical protein [Parcubacteria group bacterium]
MLSLLYKRTIASLFTVFVMVPTLFLLPFTPTRGPSTVHAYTWFWETEVQTCGPYPWSAFKECLAGAWYTLVVEIPRWIFGLVGIFFDVLLAVSLNSTMIKNPDFVDKGWVILRDISNTFFIFILLYIAISTILQTAGGQTKRLLATLIMIALFMNFSLYATRFIIDVSNVLALEFYVNIGTDEVKFITISQGGPKPLSVSKGFMRAFGIERLLSAESSTSLIVSIWNNFGQRMFLFLMIGIMYIIASVIFFKAALLFLSRVVAFWLLMILSPLAFFSFILPFTRGKVWSRWSSELISQAFLAPIFLFFLYLTLMLAANFTGKTNPFFTEGAPSSIGASIVPIIFIFLQFFMIIALLYMGLKTATGMSGALGTAMTGVGNRLAGYGKTAVGFGTGVALGAGAMAYRQSLGRFMSGQKEKYGSDWEKSKAGRVKLAIANSFAGGSGDIRSIGMVGKLTKMAGIDVGQAGGKGGFEQPVAQRRAEQSKKVEEMLRTDPAGAAKYLASLQDTISLNYNGRSRGINPDDDIKAAMSKLSNDKRQELIKNAKPGKEQDLLKRIQESLGDKMSDKEKKQAALDLARYQNKEAKDTLEEWDTKDLSLDDTIDAQGNVTAKGRIREFKALGQEEQLALYKNMTAKHRKDFLDKEGSIFDALQGKLSAQDKFAITEAAQKFEEVDKKRIEKEGKDMVKKLEEKALPDQISDFKALDSGKQLSVYRNMTPSHRDSLAQSDPTIKPIFDNLYTEIGKNRADKEKFDESTQKARDIEKKARSSANLAVNKEKLRSAPDVAAVERIFNDMQPKDIAQVDPDILLRPHVVQNLSGAALGKIATDGNFNQGQLNSLVGMILDPVRIQQMDIKALETLQKVPALSNWTSDGQKQTIAAEITRRSPRP